MAKSKTKIIIYIGQDTSLIMHTAVTIGHSFEDKTLKRRTWY